jgi:hypothetical protein
MKSSTRSSWTRSKVLSDCRELSFLYPLFSQANKHRTLVYFATNNSYIPLSNAVVKRHCAECAYGTESIHVELWICETLNPDGKAHIAGSWGDMLLSQPPYFTHVVAMAESKEEMSFNVDSALVGVVIRMAVAIMKRQIEQLGGAHDGEGDATVVIAGVSR